MNIKELYAMVSMVEVIVFVYTHMYMYTYVHQFLYIMMYDLNVFY